MTFGSIAFAQDSSTHPAKTYRQMLAGLLGTAMGTYANAEVSTGRVGHGVVGDNDFLVTPTTGLGYSVAPGNGFVIGSAALGQGTYAVYNDAAVTGSVATRDATNPRIDYIAVRVRDTDTDGSGGEGVDVVPITGVPGATPTAPSIPSSSGSLLLLSKVTVPSAANGGALTFANVRPYASVLGGMQRVLSTTKPTGSALIVGVTRIYETNTGNEWLWTAAGWRLVSPVTWVSEATFQINNNTAGADVAISFPAAPFTGVGTITVNYYYGFSSSSSANCKCQIYTNAFSDPVGGGGWIADSVFNSTSGFGAGVWVPGASMSMSIPITSGASPNAFFRLTAINGGNMYIRGYAVIQGTPASNWANP